MKSVFIVYSASDYHDHCFCHRISKSILMKSLAIVYSVSDYHDHGVSDTRYHNQLFSLSLIVPMLL